MGRFTELQENKALASKMGKKYGVPVKVYANPKAKRGKQLSWAADEKSVKGTLLQLVKYPDTDPYSGKPMGPGGKWSGKWSGRLLSKGGVTTSYDVHDSPEAAAADVMKKAKGMGIREQMEALLEKVEKGGKKKMSPAMAAYWAGSAGASVEADYKAGRAKKIVAKGKGKGK